MPKNYDKFDVDPFLTRNRKKFLIAFIVIGIIIFSIFFFSTEDQQGVQPKKETEEKINQTNQTTSPPTPTTKEPVSTVMVSDYEIVRTYIREGTQYYTQGLTFKDEHTLLESTGLYGESNIQYISLDNMTVITQKALGAKYFGEGCDFFNQDKGTEIAQLTWREFKIFIYDAKTLEQKRIMDWPKQVSSGWGFARRDILTNGEHKEELYVTDGTFNIYVLEPENFTVIRSMKCLTSSNKTVPKLNELEFIEGKLWANIYYQNTIAIINPDTGYVEKFLQLDNLVKEAKTKADTMGLKIKDDYVLNGIAYHPATKRLIVTGKKWPLMWEIKVKGVNA